MIDFSIPSQADNLDVVWIHGSPSAKHNTDPDIQVHKYNEHTFILRQNKAVHYEAPFLFLFFGSSKCILFDTGATKEPKYFPLRQTIDQLIADWLERNTTTSNEYELIVAHTHLHKDHFEGDAQFADRPHTTIVGKSYEETVQFYGFQQWPYDDNITYDLGGGRELCILATPGHEDAEVSVYDPYTRLLLTGDLVLPGRLYVRDWQDFTESIERLVEFAHQHEVSHILGCHIEMSRFPREEYLIRSTYQPFEAKLQMTTEQLKAVQAAIVEVDGKPGKHIFDDFIIYNGVPDRYFAFDAMTEGAEPGDVCMECMKERRCC